MLYWYLMCISGWGRENSLDLDLKEQPMDGNDVHDSPTPIVNLTQPRECDQLISSFATGHFLEITIVDVMNM